MISPLRARHRRTVIFLALVLPLLVLVALSARRPVAPVAELPLASSIEEAAR